MMASSPPLGGVQGSCAARKTLGRRNSVPPDKVQSGFPWDLGPREVAINAHILEESKKLWSELNHRTY